MKTHVSSKPIRAFLAGAMLLAAAPIGSVPTANAQDYSTDELFYLFTTANGWGLTEEEAAAQGAAVCVVFASGTTLPSLVYQVVEMHPDWTTNDAARLVGAAAEAYCPEDDYI
ncbi:DUF732 domain-containing protein [Mycolicibacterium sp. XJ1819]